MDKRDSWECCVYDRVKGTKMRVSKGAKGQGNECVGSKQTAIMATLGCRAATRDEGWFDD